MDLRQLFGRLDKDLLRDYFKVHDVELDVEWDKIPKRHGKKTFDAWCKLEPEHQHITERWLLDVARLGQERGVFGMIKTAAELDTDLKGELEPYEGSASKILHVIVKHPLLWEQIKDFVELDLLVTKRFWRTYLGFPQQVLDDPKALSTTLKDKVAAFFQRERGQGRTSDVVVRERGDSIYIFIYLDAYRENEMAVTSSGRIEPTVHRPAFDVVFAFHPATGMLDLMAKGGKLVTEPLCQIFSETAFDIQPPEIDRQEDPYQFDRLLDPAFKFPFEKRDGVTRVALVSLDVGLKGQGKRRMSLIGDPDRGDNDVHAMILEYFRDGLYTPLDLFVYGARFKIWFERSGPIKKRSITFKLSWPRSNDFKDEDEAVRNLIEKYLRRWKLDVHEPALELAGAV